MVSQQLSCYYRIIHFGSERYLVTTTAISAMYGTLSVDLSRREATIPPMHHETLFVINTGCMLSLSPSLIPHLNQRSHLPPKGSNPALQVLSDDTYGPLFGIGMRGSIPYLHDHVISKGVLRR